jgi:hypothetical protein
MARGQEYEYVGNTLAAADPARLVRSKTAVDAFLRDLVAYAGWPSDRVVLLVDGIRYPNASPIVLNSYFVQMRSYFIAEARRAGFEVVDMDERFFAKLNDGPVRFEFPTDAHWNGTAHGLAADAVMSSSLFGRWKPREVHPASGQDQRR